MDKNESPSSSSGSDSDTDLSEINIWNTPKPSCNSKDPASSVDIPKTSGSSPALVESVFVKKMKFHSQELDRLHSAHIQSKVRKIEKRREKRRVKAASKLAKNVDNEAVHEEKRCEKEWQAVKPFMGVFDHIAGPIGHGKLGPKTELEHQVDDCLEDGNFEKAQMLSDRLANREFAVKVSRAFAARKATELKVKEDREKEAKKRKRLNWGFETKERWQMKGNM